MINILKEASNLYSIPPETASEYAWAPLKGQDLVKPNKDITNFLRYSPLKRNGQTQNTLDEGVSGTEKDSEANPASRML